MPNEKGEIRPGTYAHAKLTAELPAAWAVPAAAIMKLNEEPVMYLVEGGKAVRVSVQLGRGDNQFTQIRRYRKPSAIDWTDVTGAEQIASPAASVTDGQAVPGMKPDLHHGGTHVNFFVGTSGYSYPEWKGSFYPAKFPAKQMLGFYSRHFRTVEINNTFYRAPTAQLLNTWAEQVPADFRFVLKAPQEITHAKQLAGVGEAVSSLVEVAGALKERLGPLLFQLPPHFKKDVPRLSDFLAYLPACRVAFEFRHQSWFDEEVFELLRDHQAAMCLADAEGELEVPFVSTADWGYLRLRRPDYDNSALKMWEKQIRSQNWRECFVFFKHEDAGKGPRMATQLLENLAGGAQKRAA